MSITIQHWTPRHKPATHSYGQFVVAYLLPPFARNVNARNCLVLLGLAWWDFLMVDRGVATWYYNLVGRNICARQKSKRNSKPHVG